MNRQVRDFSVHSGKAESEGSGWTRTKDEMDNS